MHIIWKGQSCFQILSARAKAEQVSIAIDPFDEATGLKLPSFQADILLITHNHHDHNNKKAIKGEPLVIEGPGEYEAKEVYIQGISSWHDENNGKEKGINTIYLIEAEEMRICHLGDLGIELEQKELDLINSVDILMIPIGGNYTIDYKKAIDLIKKIEPAIIIPMHYKINGSTIDIADEKKFCNEIGNCSREKVSRINFKKNDLEEKVMETIVMNPD